MHCRVASLILFHGVLCGILSVHGVRRKRDVVIGRNAIKRLDSSGISVDKTFNFQSPASGNQTEMLSPRVVEPVPVVGHGVAEESRAWIKHLTAQEKDDLVKKVGREIYDDRCVSYIINVITSTTGEHEWWLFSLQKDPLVAESLNRDSESEIQQKWDTIADKDVEVAPGVKKKIPGGFSRFISATFGSIGRWNRKRKARNRAKSDAAENFKAELAAIKRGDPDPDTGRVPTICDLDYSTLKLWPWNRAWHNDLRENDRDGFCDAEGPEMAERNNLGYMDADRVVRATQMAIYQVCHYKCLQFVIHNFEKAIGKTFCDLNYEQQRMQVSNVEFLLRKLIGRKESPIYTECSMLFAEDDAGAELVDFAIESVCSTYSRPTPMYFPSESPPLKLYKDASIVGGIIVRQPVCRPVGINASGDEAVQVGPGIGNRSAEEPQRYCTEGTHCKCQRASRMDHVAAPQSRIGTTWTLFKPDHWFANDHCSSIRPSGPQALTWINPNRVASSQWAGEMRSYRRKNHGTKIGAALIVMSGILAALQLGAFSALGGWITASAIPWITGTAWPAIVSAFGWVFGGAATAGGTVTAGIGPAIVLAVIGIGFIIRDQTFDCSAKIGCYPLSCEYHHELKHCMMSYKGINAHMEGPKMAVWWLPPPSTQCALMDKKWWKLWKSGRSCVLRACTHSEMAKNMVGMYLSPVSVEGKKFDFLNCQPLNVKEMNAFQQNEFFKALRDEVRLMKDGRIRDNKQLSRHLWSIRLHVPECLTHTNCRHGLEGDEVELPLCVDGMCRKPVVQTLEIEIDGAGAGDEWKRQMQTYLAISLWGPGGEEHAHRIVIVEDDAEGDPVHTCDTGPDEACKVCVELEHRTGNDQCSECNDGYHLSGFICEAYTCVTGDDAACKECVEQENRTGDGQCSDCNDGFHVADDFTCEADDALMQLRQEVQVNGSEDVPDDDFVDLVDADSGTPAANIQLKQVVSAPVKKKFKLIVRASGAMSDDDKIIPTLRAMKNHDGAVSAVDLDVAAAFPPGFAVEVTDLGTLCERRDQRDVPHSVEVCGPTKSGYGCALTCEEGWAALSTTVCDDDGEWSDLKPADPAHVVKPVYECRQAVCPPLPLSDSFCPRGVRGCYQWDSGCDRGGMSGTPDQKFCVVTPTDGYYLKDPSNDKWHCTLRGNWEHLPEFSERPAILEWKCAAPPPGQVDTDSGVESTCDETESGRKTPGDVVPGLCKVVCQTGYMPWKTDPLRCSEDNKWIGMAKCEEVACYQEDIPESLVDPEKVQVECPGSIGMNEKARSTCTISCVEDTDKLEKNDLYCNTLGEWKGTIKCKSKAGGGPGGPGTPDPLRAPGLKDAARHGASLDFFVSAAVVLGFVVAVHHTLT